ncbi:uncharacterized protein F4807DRAFT_59913 [Annulohypoxylon truncatum]|uniref:uncharacterized protein n=1 Tax=Annulohypoxylon truncatum TaxID=327061 RepID=UPI002008260F|nr:uncharacterized protein F4807DRAFT_59913 [Annulohypoxylon truncatum]KAI1210301.1 hypothetical protein F4807DRAFT_59913 [Annulohypoxylon truncatum]
MSCSCRTTPLRVFIQSLTDLRLSDSTVTTPRTFQPRYTRAVALRSQFILTRPYTATAALSYPRRVPSRVIVPRELPSQSLATHQAPRATQKKQTNDETVNQPSVEALDTSTRDYEKAKSTGVLLDLSPESIDSLVADLEESPPQEPLPRNLKFGPAVHDEPEVDRKPPRESSRLKRLKILKDLKERRQKQVKRLPRKQQKEYWRIQKEALKKKFPEGWKPRKRLSPDALDGIRALHAQFPDHFTTEVLADKFMVSVEAIRRILRGNWQPSPEEDEERQRRWFSRGKNIWSQMAAIGRKPPRKWRQEGIVRDPIWNVRKGPRTQPPKRRGPRRYHEDVDPVFEEIPNIESVEEPKEEHVIDANEEFHRQMKMQMNRKSNRRFNKGSNRKFSKDPNRKFSKGHNRDSARGSDESWEIKRSSDREPDRDAFDRAFDKRFDPDANRGARRSRF